MELRIEAVPGCSLPNGCFVGVRVGEVLKQGRYDPSCCYRFPALERQRNAKIDLYKHLGTCCTTVDPDAKGNNELKVSGAEPGFGDLRLKVTSRPEEDGKQPANSKQRDVRKVEVKKQAKDYLSRHRIEERLCIAVKALLAAQPDDATAFLIKHLSETDPKAVERRSRAPPPVLPFSSYYRTNGLQQVPPASWNKMYTLFPRAAVASTTRPSPSKPASKPAPTSAVNSATAAALLPFKAYYNENIAPLPLQRFWDSTHAKFSRADQSPPTHVKLQLNMTGLRPLSSMTSAERCEVERVVVGALGECGGELEGDYLPLPTSTSYFPRPGGMTEDEMAELRVAGVLFPFEAPDGRGVFATPDGNTAVWINAGCHHVQLLMKQSSAPVNIDAAAGSLARLEKAIFSGLEQDGYAFKRTEMLFAGAFARMTGRLVGLRPVPQMTTEERSEAERIVTKALLEMSGAFEGEYFPLRQSASFQGMPTGMSEAEEAALASKGLLFPRNSADGRGVYTNNAKDVAVWINEGSHVQILVKSSGKQTQDLARAKNAEGILRDALKQSGYGIA